MNNSNFKVGDKVRLRNPKQFSLGTRILTIIDSDCGGKFIPVWYKGIKGGWYFPLKPCEIELVNEKGKQLLFDFMRGS